jgi:hypothetical protein
LPELSAEQRTAALAEAGAARTARGNARAALKSDALPPSEFLQQASEDPRLAAMRVSAFIESLPGYGSARSQALMTRLRIAESRRIRGLGPKQRVALLAAIGQAAESST